MAFPTFKSKSCKNCLLNVFKLSVVNTFSSPSILYETIPALGAVIYSDSCFNFSSYDVLSSIKPFKYEPDGLFSPIIFAFFVI